MDEIKQLGEIKSRKFEFRVWDMKDKKMIHLHELYPTEECAGHLAFQCSENFYHHVSPAWIRGRDFVLMQMTGVYDLNGEDTYEYDMIDTKNGKMLVYWDTSKLAFKIKNSKHECFLGDLEGNFVVMNNIFENHPWCCDYVKID